MKINIYFLANLRNNYSNKLKSNNNMDINKFKNFLPIKI